MSARGFVETAPRAFELALHFVAALRQGAFGLVLSHAWAAGHPVNEVSGPELGSLTRGAMDALVRGEFTALAARAWVGTFDARPGERVLLPDAESSDAGGPPDTPGEPDRASTEPWDEPVVEALAVVDATLAGSGWFAAGRFVWSAADFGDPDEGRPHERLVFALDDPADDTLRAYRLCTHDVVAQATMSAVRHAVLRELVLRPAFSEVTQALVGAGDVTDGGGARAGHRGDFP